jgi:lipopolysaccharide export system permease protein
MTVGRMREEIARIEEQKARRLESLTTRVQAAGFPSYEAFEADLRRPSAGARWLGLLAGIFGRASAPPDTSRAAQAVVASLEIDRAEVENLERRIDSFEVEIHKKFSIPAACVVFVLVGGPLGIRTRKGGFANMAIAVGFFVAYYLFLIAGEQLADRRLASPLVAMWLPNLVFGLLGIYLTVSVVGWGPSRGMR